MVETNGERESGKLVLAERHDDNYDITTVVLMFLLPPSLSTGSNTVYYRTIKGYLLIFCWRYWFCSKVFTSRHCIKQLFALR